MRKHITQDVFNIGSIMGIHTNITDTDNATDIEDILGNVLPHLREETNDAKSSKYS